MTQTELKLDAVEGGRLRDEGIGRVGQSHDEWRNYAYEGLVAFAERNLILDSDGCAHFCYNVLGIGRPRDGRAWGSVFRIARINGVIEVTGEFTLTTQPKLHRCPRRLWKSKIYEGQK